MTTIEDAQIRVARAEDEKQKLLEEITNNKKYGSIAGLDQVCSRESSDKKGGARELRRNYNKATKELRLAKSDLKRMRNEEGQAKKGENPPIDPGYAAAMSRLEAAHKAVHRLQQDPLARYCSVEDLRAKARSDPKAKALLTELNPAMNARRDERKNADAMAPRYSCWNCSSFSVNNYEKPCRDDQLDPGDLPILDCPVFDETYASLKAHQGEAMVEVEGTEDGITLKNVPEEVLEDPGERVGLYFTNHDLRRTCGRMMYRAGVRLEEISRIFGHADTRTTILYLGLNFDDMSDAMRTYAQYQKMSLEPKMVQNELSQSLSGQSGICSRKDDWLS
jgi:hypothetical protein